MTLLSRTLEPEVMDTRDEAVDYDSMDHSDVNRVFVDDLYRLTAVDDKGAAKEAVVELGHVFDVGTGTALIPIELCQRPDLVCRVTAADYALEMLRIAKRNVVAAGLDDRVALVREDCKQLTFADDEFDTVISNSIVHHIPEPVSVFREMVRVLRPGGCLFVRDLLRPDSAAVVDQIVDTYADGANDHQRQMFRESLHAALTVEEVRELLKAVGLPADAVSQTTDRHWTIEVRSA